MPTLAIQRALPDPFTMANAGFDGSLPANLALAAEISQVRKAGGAEYRSPFPGNPCTNPFAPFT